MARQIQLTDYLSPWWRISLFKISREKGLVTEDVLQGTESSSNSTNNSNRSQEVSRRAFESTIIFLLFALFSGQLPPDVNESHYLTKAKHFWNPDYCPDDIFLSSSFTHLLFYVSTGWLTQFLSLSAVAWTGRILTWILLAFAWQRVCWFVFSIPWLSVFGAMVFLVLNERFHLAGEWVIGGLEAKGFAYFFVLLALGNMTLDRWKSVWPLLGLASAFHVLVGGWAVVAAMFTWSSIQWKELERSPEFYAVFLKRTFAQLPMLIGGGLIALLGILPPILSDQRSLSDTVEAARLIYVNHRIAHHLNFDAFPTSFVARFVFITLAWYVTVKWLRHRWPIGSRSQLPIYYFTLGSLLISFAGLCLSGLAEQNNPSGRWFSTQLRFYWFRLADFAVPTAFALAGSAVIYYWLKIRAETATRICATFAVICIVGSFAGLLVQRYDDMRPRADQRSLPAYLEDDNRTQETYRNWIRVCGWVRNNTPQDSVFITPNQQQTFKWYAQRTEIICWKDIPQNAESIIEWERRLHQLYEPQRRYPSGLMSYSDEQLIQIGNTYEADYLLIPQRHVDSAHSETTLEQVYPEDPTRKSTYVILKLPK